MAAKVLHIVGFDNPFPPDYGGAIDVYYKIVALHRAGVVIHLHFFMDRRRDLEGLRPFCETISTYPKYRSLWSILGKKPLAVAFRESGTLKQNLLKIDAPILFEGLHTTACLLDGVFKTRNILLRAHNIEADYYKGLASSATSLPQRLLMRYEAWRLQNYEESILKQTDVVLALSRYEFDYFKEKTSPTKAFYVPVFQENEEVAKLSEYGEYAFYHGDLNISDNLRVAKALIKVFKTMDYPLIIAGSKRLEIVEKASKGKNRIKCVKIESAQELNELFAKAHINICWSFQRSGTKLKVVNALYQGRHCIINENVIDDGRASALCHQVNTFEDLRGSVMELKDLAYRDRTRRQEVLSDIFDTYTNAKCIVGLL